MPFTLQLENCPLDRKTFIVQQKDEFVINRVITQGEVRYFYNCLKIAKRLEPFCYLLFVLTVGKQPVAWKGYCADYWLKELLESMDRCTCHCDITEILLKMALNLYNHSIYLLSICHGLSTMRLMASKIYFVVICNCLFTRLGTKHIFCCVTIMGRNTLLKICISNLDFMLTILGKPIHQ